MKIDSIVEQLYSREEEAFVESLDKVSVSVRINLTDCALIDQLVQRFGGSRAELCRDLVGAGLTQLFESLKSEDRRKLGEAADQVWQKSSKEQAKKAGGTVEHLGSYWAALAAALDDRDTIKTNTAKGRAEV